MQGSYFLNSPIDFCLKKDVTKWDVLVLTTSRYLQFTQKPAAP